MSLGKQVAQGAFWNYGAFLVSKGLLFVATLILARILSPSEFGLVGMALLVITGLDILRDFGIGAAVIYRQRDGQAAANVAFFLASGIGVALFLGNLVLAPFFTQFFATAGPGQDALVTALLQVLGLSLLFASLGSTHDALLKKQIDYRRRMIPEVGRTLVKGLLQVGLALLGFGVWSLVIGQVVGEACATLLLWRVTPWRPSFAIDWSPLRPILNYGKHIMLLGGLGWILSDVDYMIIGTMLGARALGLYTLAYRIPELIIINLAQAVAAVAFPVAARFQDDLAALRDAYLRMQHYMLLILAPLAVGLAAVTPALMHLLFSTKWDEAILPMQILALYTLGTGISHWPGVVYKATGRPDILNRLAVLKVALLVPTLWWCAVNYGIVGVAWGQLGIRVVTTLIDMAVVARVVQVSMRANLRAIAPALAAALLMGGAVRLLFLTLNPAEDSLPVLVVAIGVGAAVYTGLVWLLDREATTTVLALGRDMLHRRRGPAPSGLPAAK